MQGGVGILQGRYGIGMPRQSIIGQLLLAAERSGGEAFPANGPPMTADRAHTCIPGLEFRNCLLNGDRAESVGFQERRSVRESFCSAASTVKDSRKGTRSFVGRKPEGLESK